MTFERFNYLQYSFLKRRISIIKFEQSRKTILNSFIGHSCLVDNLLNEIDDVDFSDFNLRQS